MKAVMLSIQPKWCELIASGKKTIEVRKTAPKLEMPFKCYIYDTKGTFDITLCPDLNARSVKVADKGRGKVIGEFVCDSVELLFNTNGNPANYMKEILPDILQRTALSYKEFQLYTNNRAGRNSIYGWHISDLKIYDKPKELSEFKRECKQYGAENPLCDDCRYYDCCKGIDYDESDCVVDGLIPLTRPFQSWGYVEELSK